MEECKEGEEEKEVGDNANDRDGDARQGGSLLRLKLGSAING